MRGPRSRRIQTTMAAAFATVVLATALVLSFLSYSFTQDAVQQSARDYTAQLIDQIQITIDSYVTHMKNVAEVVNVNEGLQSLLTATRPGDTAAVRLFLNNIARTRRDISLILVIGNNGLVLPHAAELAINGSVDIGDQRWYTSALARPGDAVVSSSHVQNVVDGEYRWVITLSRTIDSVETGEVLGVLLVDLNFSVINDLVNRVSLGRRGYLFIVDSEGRIVYHPRQELIYSDLEHEYIDAVLGRSDGTFAIADGKGERLYTVSTSDSTGWRTVGVNYSAEMVRNRGEIRRTYALGAFISAIAAVALAIVISHHISRPILRLRSSMQSVERGDFDVAVNVTSNNEIGDLARDFQIMVGEIKELVRRNAEEHEAKRKSELLALQNQIAPHFLYNTLDSVIWMAEARQHDHVITTVAALARLLRLSISRGDELISIRDEVEHIQSYLTIQKLRYRDRLDFEVVVDPSILELRTPKVILQPLVENAIYHGIKNTEDGGTVRVHGRRTSDSVVLTVSDDGLGVDPGRLTALLEVPHGGDVPGAPMTAGSGGGSRAKVGVRNVHQRIQLYFGSNYGLRFSGERHQGLSVEVHLPAVHPADGVEED